MSWPSSFVVEFSPTTTPTQTPVWTDITPYVLECNPAGGRNAERPGERFESRTLTLRLRNEDRRFEPEYAASPYSPGIVPQKRIRVRASWNALTYSLFTGYVDGWPLTWAEFNRSEVVVTAADAFKLLARVPLSGTPWSIEVETDKAIRRRWYELADPSGSTVVADANQPSVSGQIFGEVEMGADSLIASGQASMRFSDANPGRVVFAPGWTSVSGTRTVEGWFEVRPSAEYVTDPSANNHFIYSSSWLRFHYTPLDQSLTVTATNVSGARSVTASALALGRHHVRVVASSSPSLVVSLYIDNVLIGTSSAGTGGNWVGSWPQEALGGVSPHDTTPWTGPYFTGRLQGFVFYEGDLGATRATAHYQAGAFAWAGDTTGARMNRILALIGWPAADQQIDSGRSRLQAVSELSGSALEYLHRVAESEQGMFYVTGDGKVRFRERHALYKSPLNVSQATFGDAGSGAGFLAYLDLKPDHHERLLINEASVGREGGPVFTVSDAVSKAAYFTQGFQRTDLLNESDLEVLDLGNWLVSQRKDPRMEFRSLEFSPVMDSSASGLWAQALGRDFGDLITVKRKPAAGAAVISKDARIQHIAHSIFPAEKRWRTTFQLAPAETVSYWTIGVSAMGTGTRFAF